MDYIVVFNDIFRDHSILEDNHELIAKFSSYEDAKCEAVIWKDGMDFKTYTIYIECTDLKHHII